MKRILSIVCIVAMMLSFATISANAYESNRVVAENEGLDDNFSALTYFGFVGDVDMSDSVDITDATYIQMYLADKFDLYGANYYVADVNQSDDINVFDVTSIQRWLAKMSGKAPIYHQLGTNEYEEHVCRYAIEYHSNKCQDGGFYMDCSECGDSFISGYLEESHNYMVLIVQEPTCRNGFTEVLCEDCGKHTWIDQTDAVKEHDFRVLEVQEAGCEEGYTSYKCNGCGIYEERDVIEGTGHDFEVIGKIEIESECEGGCTTRIRCKGCGQERLSDYVEGTGHIWGEEEKVEAPSCENGYTYVECTVCNQRNKYNYVEGTGHDMGEWEIYKAPTYEAEGEERCYCSKCDEYYVRTVDKLIEGNQDAIKAAQEMLSVFQFSVDYFDTVDQAFAEESFSGVGSFKYTFYIPLNWENKYEIDEETRMRVYKRSDLDELSLRYFGRTYDWESMTTPYDIYNEEYYDEATDTVRVRYFGGFGGGTSYRVSSCVENADGTYTLGLDTTKPGSGWRIHTSELVLKKTEYGYNAVSFRKFK